MSPFLAALLAVFSAACSERAVSDSSKPLPADAALGAPLAMSDFVENRGQWPEEVLFHARVGGVDATLARDSMAFAPVAEPDGERPIPLVLRLPAHGSVRVEGADRTPTQHHFHLATGSASGAAGYERVRYREVLPGVDIELRTDGGAFEYDLHVDPGAGMEDLVIEVDGAERLELVDPDRLVLHTASGPVEQRIGPSWQFHGTGGEREPLACRFRLLESEGETVRFGFEAPGRDPSYALVLDPSLSWSTFIGGSMWEQRPAVAVGDDGAVHLVCWTSGFTPVTPGAFDTTFAGGGFDLWVGKLSADGSTLEWGTYLGGTEAEDDFAIEVDSDGSVVVAGSTWSDDFPTTPGSMQPVIGGTGGKSDFFVTRLSPDGSSLLWSTFYGGPSYDFAGNQNGVLLLPNGDVVVAGESWSLMPMTPGAYDTEYTYADKLIFRVSADGSQLVFATYFACAGITDLAVGDDSDIYLTGGGGPDLATTPGAYMETPSDENEGFVAKLDGSGSSLLWATYLGGPGSWDVPNAIALDAASAIYIASKTGPSGFPVTEGAFESADGNDGAVTKLLPEGTGLVWSTYLASCCGGSSYPSSIAVDAAGNVSVAGAVNEPFFPTTPDAFQPTFASEDLDGDGFLTKFDAFGETLVYSTFFGGKLTDYFVQHDLDSAGNPVIALQSYSSDLPVTPGAYQTALAGSPDIAAAKLDLALLPWTVLDGGLKGTADVPNLAGSGALTPGAPTRLSVRGAAPDAGAWLVAGFTSVDQPFLGGTLVPAPDHLFAVTTDAAGALDLETPWPAFPPATAVYLQVWVADPGAPQGWSASNALRALSP